MLEVFYRGYSHISMFFLGGLCFIIVGRLNEEYLEWDTPLLLQGLLGSILITLLEFVTGCIFNICLKLNVWDYSDSTYNVLGQICLEYSILWILVSIIAIVIDDYLRYWLFGEDKPKYKII